MKIDLNAAFSKNVADPSPLLSVKDGVSANRAAAAQSATAGQSPASSVVSLLPSTNGDFDTARVSKIRADISAGRYRVDTSKIADGLLASVRDLMARRTA